MVIAAGETLATSLNQKSTEDQARTDALIKTMQDQLEKQDKVMQAMLMYLDRSRRPEGPSLQGSKYLIVFVDTYSRYTWCKPLKSKSETSKALREFIQNVPARPTLLFLTYVTKAPAPSVGKLSSSFSTHPPHLPSTPAPTIHTEMLFSA